MTLPRVFGLSGPNNVVKNTQLKCEVGAKRVSFDTDLFIFMLFIVALTRTAFHNKSELFTFYGFPVSAGLFVVLFVVKS